MVENHSRAGRSGSDAAVGSMFMCTAVVVYATEYTCANQYSVSADSHAEKRPGDVGSALAICQGSARTVQPALGSTSCNANTDRAVGLTRPLFMPDPDSVLTISVSA